jgi:hypothetical protein
MLVMNMALESWGLRPLPPILVLLLALLVPGFITASLLLRRASRRAGRDEAVLIANRSGSRCASRGEFQEVATPSCHGGFLFRRVDKARFWKAQHLCRRQCARC